MDFEHSEAHRELSALTRQIVEDRVTVDRLRAVEKTGSRFDPELWTTLADAGVFAAALPAEAGGGGYGLLEQCGVLVELGRGLAPAPYLTTIAVGASALARFGDADQQAAWVAPAMAGRLVIAAAWPRSGDSAAIDGGDPRAERIDAGWRLNGSVDTVTAGPVADLILVLAETPEGPGVFLVAPDDPGVTLRRQRMIDLDDAALLEFSDVALGPDRRLGGSEVSTWLRRRATVATVAYQLGVVERALEMTAEYAAVRTQFGRPIGAFQAVSQRLADGYIDVKALGLALWQAAWTLEHAHTDEAGDPTDATVDAAVDTAKYWAAEAGHRVAHTTVHIHGGTGIDVDHPAHRYFLAAKRAEFEGGGATAHLLTLGATLAQS
jgi:alkylation response protein AidB-like acyl-CoA dehydrogenase